MTDIDKVHGYRYWTLDELGRLRSPYYSEYIWEPGENDASKLSFGKLRSKFYSWWDPRKSVKPDYGTSYSRIRGPELVFGVIKTDPAKLINENSDRTMTHSHAEVGGVVKPISAQRDEMFLARELKVARTKFFWFGAVPILLGGLATSLFWTHNLAGLWFILLALVVWGFFEAALEYHKSEIEIDMVTRWKRFEHNYPEVKVFNTESQLYRAFPYPDYLDVARTPETDPTFWRNP